MKVLWCTYERKTRVERYYDNWVNDLKTHSGIEVSVINAPTYNMRVGELRKAVVANEFSPSPDISACKTADFVVVEDLFTFWNSPWDKIKVPKALFVEDLHGNHPIQLQKAFELGFEVIFYRYKTHFEKDFSHLKRKIKCIWVPMSVSEEHFKPLPKIREVVFFGTYNKVYPMRKLILEELKGATFFDHIKRPKELTDDWERWPTGEDYAQVLGESMICPTGGSVYHYPVAKFFEIPLSGALLMSDWFDELGLLGFKHRVNMVVLQPTKIRNQVTFWLENKDLREKVAKAGRDFVLKNHTGSIRAKQFVSALENLLDEKEVTSSVVDNRPISSSDESFRQVSAGSQQTG